MRALSSYASGSTIRALTHTDKLENRLAIALTPVRSVIRVIDDSKPPMTVDWSRVGKDSKGKPLAMSYTDFTGSRIAVNPLPIMDNRLDPGAAIDVVTGYAMHEASHAKHSRDRWKYLIKRDPARGTLEPNGQEVPAFEPMRVAGYLWNLAEDIRIEDCTSREWRGFGPYFTNLLDYMWDDHLKDNLPTEYGTSVEDKIKIVFHACRYTERARTHLPAEVQAEVEWWKQWQLDYLTDAVDTPTTIQRGLDHLGEDPATAEEMRKMAEDERKERERGEKIRAQIERLMREGIGDAPMVCISEDGEVTPLTAEQAETVDKLVKEGLASVTPIIKHRGSAKPAIRVRKPAETPASRRAYIGHPDAATEALRSALVFRSEKPRYDLKLQREGDLDDEELYRWGMGDNRLFTQRVIEAVPDTFLGMLVDMSGSMMGYVDGSDRSKIETAQRLAQLFLWATHDMDGVTTAVWGHTGDSSSGRGSDLFRLWEPGDPLRRLGLITALDHGNNYDGYAIAYCADQMRQQQQPQKVLIVLSDGYPAGSQYGGEEAQRHMLDVCQWARSQGVEVIQIAIDEELRPQDQSRMFGPGNWMPYKSESQLPRDLTRTLERFAK